MQDNPSPSALAIRRATRLRALNRMRRSELDANFSRAARAGGQPYLRPSDNTKDALIDEILHLEGLDMQVLS